MRLRCIVVDDESLARKLLAENIQQIPFLELVGSCKNAFEAMRVLEEKEVDLLFLDIQMPGMLGTQFLESLRKPPMVIFVTAYANYAVESYELEVVDYLLKPVSLERFTKAAFRALDLKKNNHPVPATEVTPTLSPQTAGPPTEPFFVNVEYALVKIVPEEVTHVEGMKDYIKIYIVDKKRPILTKFTLKGIEEKLPRNGFMRVHKSFIVNLDKIESIRNHQITIAQFEIPVSESNMDQLLKRIGYAK